MDSTRLEALLENTGWLHALARSLVGDGADDVIQDACVVALTRRHPVEGSARSWLGGVVRNLARREHRGAGRRQSREREVARAERVPGADDLL